MNKININSIIRKCSVFALAGLLASCVTDSVTNDECEKSTLILNFNIPTETVTRAVTDATVSAEEGEATINDMKVWVFNSSDGADATALRYSPFAKSAITQASDNSVRLRIGVPRDLSTCDLYILANATSTGIGGSLDANTTRAQLEAATFNATPLNATNGLPLARIIKGVNTSSLLNTDNALSIALLRSVSKINVYLTKDVKLKSTDVSVNSISFNNSAASTASVFPQSTVATNAASNATQTNVPSGATFDATTFPIANSLVSGAFPYPVAKQVSNALTWESTETGDAFISRMNSSADLVEKAYFLESNQKATCTINYTIGGETKEKTFDLWDATPGLIRNHNVVVYGHFVGRDLYVTPTVLPWNNAETVSYSLDDVQASVSMKNGHLSGTSYIASAYDGKSVGTYYPQFTVTFVTPIVDRWLLQSTNPDFGFKINLNDDIQDYIEGVGGSSNSITFYVVPKNEFVQSKYEADASQYNTTIFVTVPGIPTLGRVKFNAGTVQLPGTTQGVTIHQISQSNFDNGNY